jgi:hypothetical protein
MKTILIALLGFSFAAILVAQDQTNKPPVKKAIFDNPFFPTVSLSNDAIVATMPLTQIRFLSFLNGTNTGFVSSSKVFILKSGEKLELAEKHTSVTAEPLVTPTNAELKVTIVFDGRSFGDSVKTNSDTIKLK